MIVRHRDDLIYDPTFEVASEPGSPGRDGIDGRDGVDGRDGRDGTDGRGFNWRGKWKPRDKYAVGDCVLHKGSSFIAVRDGKNREPTSKAARFWNVLAKRGSKGERGEDGISQRGPRGRDGATIVVGSVETLEAVFDSEADRGAVVYVASDGHVDLAQANGEPQALAIGMASTAVSAGQSGEVITSGPVTNEAWNLSPGSVYYLDPASPGGITSTYPANAGDFVVILGAAVTPTQLALDIHWSRRIGV